MLSLFNKSNETPPIPAMLSNSSCFALLAILYSFAHILYALLIKGSKKIKLPPGPKGLPIIGNLHRFSKLPHHDLHKLANKYGDIMSLRLGLVHTVVVSSPSAAREFLQTHDIVFANRPFTETAKYVSYDNKGLASGLYGSSWRSVRKLCTLHLLSATKIDSFRPMRRRELGLLVQSVKRSAEARQVVDVSARLTALTTDMTCLMVFGKKYVEEDFDERGFKAVIHEVLKLSAAFNLADFVPFVGVLDLQGLRARMKNVSKVFDGFFEKIIDEHMTKESKGSHERDFVDVLLSIAESDQDVDVKIERSNIKAIILDLLLGGVDTSATAVEWTLSELLRHPQLMKKVQEELESVVGTSRMVDEADLAHLPYLDIVLKESFRLHPVAPLLVPHESMEDITINGFHIPKFSRIIVNAWAIGRDPTAWSDPEKFYPERFIGTNIDVKGRDFELLPFGSGRRSCPGMQLGLTVTRLVLAQLVHCFDWELQEGISPTQLDMTEEFGLSVSRATNLLAIPSYRLKDDMF